ncbi:DUF1778 domain-containing protein [Salmonella enterica subsp. enterica]|nr:DUF1778 domain-containing protein [Salmonella enterica subsp. enterica]
MPKLIVRAAAIQQTNLLTDFVVSNVLPVAQKIASMPPKRVYI